MKVIEKMNPPAQIVHEAETQRQHVRLNLPAQVEVNGQRFDVKDISSGGLAIRNANDNFKKNQIKEFTLFFPFADFELDMEIRAEILHIDPKENIAGCRFIDLTEKKISILNHVIKSFMTGDLINKGDFIDTSSETNFIHIRPYTKNKRVKPIDTLKKYAGYAVAFCGGIIIVLLFQNLLQKTKTESQSPFTQTETPATIELSPE